jgi:hypothetical protein
MKAKPAEVILSLAVSALGIATAIGTTQLPSAGGYARIGPNVAPAVIAGGLILLGLWLLYETLRRLAQRGFEEPSRGEHASIQAPSLGQRRCHRRDSVDPHRRFRIA